MTTVRAKTTHDNYVDFDYDVAVRLMDDELREQLHSSLCPCSEQEFFDAYCIEHRREFCEDFIVD